MSFSVSCEKCGGQFIAKDGLRGKSTKCPQCGHTIVIPAASPTDSSVLEIGELIDQWAPTDRAALERAASQQADVDEDDDGDIQEDAPPCPACKRPIGSNAAYCIYCELALHSDKTGAKASEEFPKDRSQLKRCRLCGRKSRYATKRLDGLCRDCAKQASNDPLADCDMIHRAEHAPPPPQKVNYWIFIIPLALVGLLLVMMALHGMFVRFQSPTPPAKYPEGYALAPSEAIDLDGRQYLVKETGPITLTVKMDQRRAVTNSSNQTCWGYEGAEASADSGKKSEKIVPDVVGNQGAWWGFRVAVQSEKDFAPKLGIKLQGLGSEPTNVAARLNVVYAAPGSWGSGDAGFVDKRETLERHFQIVHVDEKDYERAARYRELIKEYVGRGWFADSILLLCGLAFTTGAAAWGNRAIKTGRKSK